MKQTFPKPARRWMATLCLGLLLAQRGAAEQFVELTVNITTEHFHYRNSGRLSVAGGEVAPASTTYSRTLRCVVGTNFWMIDGEPGTIIKNARVTFWFTGTNIVEHSVITSVPDEKSPESTPSVVVTYPPIGHRLTRVWDSSDGNPGRPASARGEDVLQPMEKTCWLAFCSGSFLKRPGRQIPPPGDLWKEFIIDSTKFSDETTVFNDDLGLPQNIKEFAKTNHVILEYQVRESTNVLGWNFPLEFEAVQYNPFGTNGWKLLSNAKGRVTAIGVGTKPEIPADVFKYRR